MDLDTFASTVCTMVEAVGGQLEPSEDWAPMLFVQEPTGLLTIAGFDPAFLDSESGKNSMVPAIVEMITERKARSCSLVMSAWMVTIEKPQGFVATSPVTYADLGIPRASEHPDRYEVVTVLTMSRERIIPLSARIARSDHPPTLGDWLDMGEVGGRSEGRFVDAIQAALAEGEVT